VLPEMDPSIHIKFGLFTADLNSGELSKSGHRVKLQSLPFKVLTILLQHPGEVVTREELHVRAWGADVNVDFEQALGSAIKKIREALGDSADSPRFIETLARRGYRFIAPVSPLTPVAPLGISLPPNPFPDEGLGDTAFHTKSSELKLQGASSFWKYGLYLIACGIGMLLSAVAYRYWYAPARVETPARISQITYDGRINPQGIHSSESFPATFADGGRLFTSALKDSHVVLAQVSLATGEMQQLPLPSEVTGPEIDDLSPDGSKLLVRSQSPVGLEQSEEPLWIVPTNGGSASRVASILTHAAAWMPDGKNILYATGRNLFVIPVEGGAPKLFASILGRAFWLRWSPNGQLLRFTIFNLKANTSSLWEIKKGQSAPHPILEGWINPPNECCGTWTSDGKYFVFQATRDGNTDLWKISGSSAPLRLTNGPLNYEAPTAAREGEQIFFAGRDSHAEWEIDEYDKQHKTLVARNDFLFDAGRITFSRNHQWVAWTDKFGHLWRSRVDGSEKLELTPDSLQVLNAVWSPDGANLALMAHGPGEIWQIYRVNSSGGNAVKLLTNEDGGIGDPSFSPDGKSLVFGGLPYLMGGSTPRPLSLVDLDTNHLTEIPHSQGLFSPRWSPDGRYIAALTLDQRKLMLYDVANQIWKTLVEASISDPTWSSDSKAVYINTYDGANRPIYRVSVPDGRMEEVIVPECGAAATRCFLSGITPNNVPLILVEIGRGNLYSMNLERK
jgi:Tol biopolymer transport system component/DNA-binding winged helix-turn-helix (wHTH) protein